MKTSQIATIALCAAALAVLASGCGESKDWDHELRIRVFKSKGLDPGTVTVKAQQAGKTVSVKLDGFQCGNNQVRIIPRLVSGIYPPLKFWAEGSKGGIKSAERTLTISTKSEEVTLRSLILGTTPPWEPACAGVTPDGGVQDGPPKLPTGAACTGDSECEGGTCLKSWTSTGVDTTMNNGYCSSDCSSSACGLKEQCQPMTDGNGSTIGEYCLKKCKLLTDCRDKEGYTCTPANFCFPK